ncbi:MAG: hypothetical protein U0835_13645 [Isosphaeraceae bacterium]
MRAVGLADGPGVRPPDPANPAPVRGPAVRRRERPAELVFDNLGRLITLEPNALVIWNSPRTATR